MPRTSKVRRLPLELREQLHAMLDAGHTLEEITAHLKALGADVSRSGLGRYKQQVDKVAARLRESRAMAEAVIADGSAFAKCKEMFAAQGGDTRVLDDYSLFEKPAASYELLAEQDGYIVANDAEKIGSASVLLGAGRQKKGDPLDFAAGITLHKKRGDYVHKGESLATFYGAADKFEAAAAEYRSGLVYGAEKPEEAPLVYALVTKDGVERY